MSASWEQPGLRLFPLDIVTEFSTFVVLMLVTSKDHAALIATLLRAAKTGARVNTAAGAVAGLSFELLLSTQRNYNRGSLARSGERGRVCDGDAQCDHSDRTDD
jgi:hypothetical protein